MKEVRTFWDLMFDEDWNKRAIKDREIPRVGRAINLSRQKAQEMQMDYGLGQITSSTIAATSFLDKLKSFLKTDLAMAAMVVGSIFLIKKFGD
jgi:hypothetical protein